MHLILDFRLAGPVGRSCRDINSLSRPVVVFSYVAEALSGRDLSSLSLEVVVVTAK